MECWEAVLSPVSHEEVTKLPVPHPTAAPAEGLPVWSKLPTITLSSKQATCYLGRGTLTGLKDTRLSRKQVKLTLDPSTGFIHAASEGLNPSSVHCKDQMSALEVKIGAGSVLLPDGAILSLLPGLYGYRVTLTKRLTSSSSSSQPSSPSSGSSSSNASAAQTPWLKKRKRASLEPSTSTTNGSRSDNDADEEEDKPAKEEKRRRSADSAVVPSQRQEAAITDITIEAETIDAKEKEKKQENGEPDAELDERTVEEKVHAITEVLPDIPETRIRTALENLKFNVVNTIEWLLANASLTTAESSPSASRLQTSFSSPATTPSTPRSSSSFSSVSSSSSASASSSSSAMNTSSTVKPADDGGEDGVLAQELQKAYDAAAEKETALKRAEEEAKSQSIIIEMLMKEKKDMEEKSRELQGIQIELEKLYLPGEREALKGDAMKIFTLLPHRQFDSTAEQYHFRIAESQFFRLCESGGSGFTVTKVEYVVNPPLVRAFEKKRLELAEHMEWEESKPLLCFHGTAESNISNIIKHNFDFSKIGASTGNMGFYGKGIYFSEYSSYSMPYVRGGNKLLLCKVLVGRACKLSRVETGVPCREGFDSHTSPCGKEIVVFSPGQILPIYVIHYTAKRGTSFFERQMSENDAAVVEELPEELLSFILTELLPEGLAGLLSQVCRRWRECIPPDRRNRLGARTILALAPNTNEADTLWEWATGCGLLAVPSTKLFLVAAATGRVHVLQALAHDLRWYQLGKVKRLGEEAAKAGHLHVLQWLHQHLESWQIGSFEFRVLETAAFVGHTHILQWMASIPLKGSVLKDVFCSSCVAAAARGGQLETLKWMKHEIEARNAAAVHALAPDDGEDSTENEQNLRHLDLIRPFWFAAEGGHFHLLRWVVGELGYNPAASMAEGYPLFAAAAGGGRVDILEWLQDKLGLVFDGNRQACAAAAGGGHLEALQWLVARGGKLDRVVSARAAAGGQLHVLQWLFAVGCPWEDSAVGGVAEGGHIEVLRWLVQERGAEALENACLYGGICMRAASKGHLEMLKFLRMEVTPPFHWDTATSEAAVKAPKNRMAMLRWMREEAQPPCRWGSVTSQTAAELGRWKLLHWMCMEAQPPCPANGHTLQELRAHLKQEEMRSRVLHTSSIQADTRAKEPNHV
ncbi:Poly(ADP-ribose) polymerase catalytic domain containing protein [Balamuthia mandrillaris]